MRVCGIISEYDPFHNGHAYHLLEARRRCEADYVVCVMSGSFTQRGVPSLLPSHTRAEMALRCGADVVLQMPYSTSVQHADLFALGGVSILERLGVVTHISFGCEDEDLNALMQAAQAFDEPELLDALRVHLKTGMSFAAAQGKALAGHTGISEKMLHAPNNILALCYLRAIRQINAGLQPVPVKRQGSYHAPDLALSPSATAVRGALLRGDWRGASKAIPADAYAALAHTMQSRMICKPDALDDLLRYRLLSMDAQQLSGIADVAEGLEQRILQAAQKAATREELTGLIKTKRYTRARISRILTHVLMDVRKADLSELPPHARVLGFRQSARPMLRQMAKGEIPLVTKTARAPDSFALDARADALWCIGAKVPASTILCQSPVIL